MGQPGLPGTAPSSGAANPAQAPPGTRPRQHLRGTSIPSRAPDSLSTSGVLFPSGRPAALGTSGVPIPSAPQQAPISSQGLAALSASGDPNALST